MVFGVDLYFNTICTCETGHLHFRVINATKVSTLIRSLTLCTSTRVSEGVRSIEAYKSLNDSCLLKRDAMPNVFARTICI
jgi:hypothetical protein